MEPWSSPPSKYKPPPAATAAHPCLAVGAGVSSSQSSASPLPSPPSPPSPP
eukprot:CAMPEP_0183454360 /NCGR_PEP_ID=MMETSP0370-20130417/123754_1 /TAXON_ID=268820 /ORGANISM="Peridinium aciculiferum, Strain PAER-2" /LENGTH=50 /DNA_ID=CAMNT_0025645855 /DNA_START=32 /DNA_END=180 /DNA_ORIENTATION=+